MKFTRMNAALEASLERLYADLSNNDRLTYVEVEDIIEAEIEEYGGRENLLDWEIQEIREEAYTENGWREDPFPEVEDEAETEAAMTWADF